MFTNTFKDTFWGCYVFPSMYICVEINAPSQQVNIESLFYIEYCLVVERTIRLEVVSPTEYSTQ